MRYSILLVTLCTALFASSASAQGVVEGGAIRNQSLKDKFPGITAVLSNPEVARQILTWTSRRESELKDITYTQVSAGRKAEYNFSFGATRGQYIGSSSFTAVVVFRPGYEPSVTIRQEATLESVPGAGGANLE
jgi:hypothetical protein